MGNGSRIFWIDYAKVICIWLMVCCHAGQRGVILDMSYQFHMPAFFIISGMLFHPKGIGLTLKSFAVPIVFFGLLNLLFQYAIILYHSGPCITSAAFRGGQEITAQSIKSLLFDSNQSWFQGYWFVATLLFMRLLMEWKATRKCKGWILIACLIYCCIEPSLNVPSAITSFKPYHVLSCLPFFITGMYVKERKIDIRGGSFELKLLSFLVFFAVTLAQGRVDLGGLNYGHSYAIMFANACLGSWLLFNVCMLAPQREWIMVLSTGTFLILGLHGMMYGLINGVWLRIPSIANPYLPMLTGIIVLAICYPAIKWLMVKCPALLGKGK